MTTATLNGIPLQTHPQVGWTDTSGVEPHQRVFRVTKANADKLAQVTDDVTLVIDAPNRPKTVRKKLSILSIEPTNNPNYRYVRVSDGRWRWNRARVTREYNVPRRTGDTKRLQQEGVPVQIQQVQAQVDFALWSLYPRDNPSQPWSPHQVVADVVEAVVGAGNYRMTFSAKRSSTVVSAKFRESGDQAIARALAFLPGSNVKLDPDGIAIIYDELDGTEAALLAKGPVYRGPTLAASLDRKRVRPIFVEVLFERELELRFDNEPESPTTIDANARFVQNVAPVPDVTLTVNGDVKATGTWERFDDLFAAWPTPAAAPRLSHTQVQDRWLVPTFLQEYAFPKGSQQADVFWQQRIACVVQHYRQTYRITKNWMDRIRAISPYRIGVIDTQKGTRARAQVFSNYAVIPTVLGLIEAASQGDTSAMWNVTGYDPLLINAKASAPATIKIEDEDQGIFSVAYALDKAGLLGKIVPSLVTGKASYDLRKAQKGKGEGLDKTYNKMAANHQLAVILTVFPGAPNDERICHVEQVGPKDVSDRLGVSVGACNGPVFRIYVGAQSMTARFEWVDSYANSGAINEAFGLTPFKGKTQATLQLGQPTNWKQVREVAIAAASALYATLLDRPGGRHEVRLDPSMGPTGTAGQVEHVLLPNGSTRTIVSFPTQVHGVDVMALLPEWLRKQILRVPR